MANAVRVADVIAEARSWCGTPVVKQASVKGVGTDCKGLVRGVARCLGLPEAESLYAAIADYGDVIPVRLLREGLKATFDFARGPKPADVLLLRMGGKPQHLGVFTGTGVVHAYGRGSRHLLKCVIETPIDAALRAWPLDSAWRWRSVDYGEG